MAKEKGSMRKIQKRMNMEIRTKAEIQAVKV
jgi:hypothetical protein